MTKDNISNHLTQHKQEFKEKYAVEQIDPVRKHLSA